MSSIFEFARLVPSNDRAKRLFANCYLYVQKNDPFHLHFMVTVGKEEEAIDISEDDSTGHPDSDSASLSSSFDSSSSQDSDIYMIEPRGYFALTFGNNSLPQFPNLGWRVGRGTHTVPSTRNVDILLAEPKDRYGKQLASNYFRLAVNDQSGLLVLLSGLNTQSPIEYFVHGNWISIPPNSSRAMYQKSNIIRAGLCEYELVYNITNENREAFVNRRHEFIRNKLDPKTNLYTYFKNLPGDERAVHSRYIEFETRGTGKFGWVNKGIDIETGDPIAIKEIRVRSKIDWLDIKSELDIGASLAPNSGALPILDSFCEHGKPMACSLPEKYYFLLPFAISDLSRFRWSDEASRESKLAFLYGPLKGIRDLHALNIMHRDIRLANMLISSTNPPIASLCDYGKATLSERSTVTTIGPINTLAPEVWTHDPRGYSKSIDLWAFGYAIAEIMGYKCEPGNPAITSERHQRIINHLEKHATKVPEDQDLTSLAVRLLSWNPDERPTAAEALKHKCWRFAVQELLGQDDHQGKKRRRDESDEDLAPDGVQKASSDPDTKTTEEFSEETKKMIERNHH